MTWPLVGNFTYLKGEDRWEWSDGVAEIYGYEPGTVTPTTKLILSHRNSDTRPGLIQLVDEVQRHGKPCSSRHRVVDRHGSVHVVVAVGNPHYDKDGQIAGTAGFCIDITDDFDADLQQSLDEIVDGLARNRAVINQAIGMLMLVYSVSPERAFDVLAWRSAESNIKLRDIAARLVADARTSDIVTSAVRSEFDHLLLSADERVRQRGR